jgi:hypothetical protein
MTECEALDKNPRRMPRIEHGADGVDVFAELINAMNLADFMQKA